MYSTTSKKEAKSIHEEHADGEKLGDDRQTENLVLVRESGRPDLPSAFGRSGSPDGLRSPGRMRNGTLCGVSLRPSVWRGALLPGLATDVAERPPWSSMILNGRGYSLL